MEKIIEINGQQVRFKSTGATPLRFKAQFKKDFFSEILKLNVLEGIDTDNVSFDALQKIDFEVFYNIAWVLAKTADPKIGDPLTWLDNFEEFPLLEIITELQELIMSSLQSTKKK